jgi:hypothetical protein
MKKSEYIYKISLRITADQKKFITDLNEHCGLDNEAEIVRRIIDEKRGHQDIDFSNKDEYISQKNLIREINYLGHNINQIVKNNNSKFYIPAEKRKLFAMMKKIEDLLVESIRKKL